MSFADPPEPGDGECHSFTFILQLFKMKNKQKITEKTVFQTLSCLGDGSVFSRPTGFEVELLYM